LWWRTILIINYADITITRIPTIAIINLKPAPFSEYKYHDKGYDDHG
jgi:hypothetical protein